MKIAFTHNLKMSDLEEEAEFDTATTVAAICDSLTSLGHHVDKVEVSGPASKTIARLEALNPDLIFNTAEGRIGRFREAFYPGIFEQLGLPFTGSDAYVCTLTLDKNLTKAMIAHAGVPTPRSKMVVKIQDIQSLDLRYPVILKPNFEGSSKGITVDSVVENAVSLRERMVGLLASYPNGILVEEFIEGKDVTVPFIEGVSPSTSGILVPAEYLFDGEIVKNRKYQIYDYDLKNKYSDAVNVRVPAEIPESVNKELLRLSKIAYQVLGIRDMGRIDFRLTPQNELYFIEANALPSLEPGAGIYLSAAQCGLKEVKDVHEAIIASATKRYGLQIAKRKNRVKGLKVGFTYNLKRVVTADDPMTDAEAEYDAPKTLDAIRDAIRSYGHEVVDYEATSELPGKLATSDVDVVFNIAEGIRGRNREAQVPAILELLGIPYTGSDPATLSLTLDKGLAKKIVKETGIPTPKFMIMVNGKERLPRELVFPVIVKPLAEGSSKGVIGTSVVKDEQELRQLAQEIIHKYRQPALIEEFLTGREFTVALLGERRPRVLPPMEIVFLKKTDDFPVYTYQHKLDTRGEIRYDAPATLDKKTLEKIEQTARKAFAALGCRDVARIDLRMAGDGTVHFLECNPLPGLTPGWSDLCLIAQSAGIDYRTLIGEILSPAIRRYKEKKKVLLQGSPDRPGERVADSFSAGV